jgi:hypothetical protein
MDGKMNLEQLIKWNDTERFKDDECRRVYVLHVESDLMCSGYHRTISGRLMTKPAKWLFAEYLKYYDNYRISDKGGFNSGLLCESCAETSLGFAYDSWANEPERLKKTIDEAEKKLAEMKVRLDRQNK